MMTWKNEAAPSRMGVSEATLKMSWGAGYRNHRKFGSISSKNTAGPYGSNERFHFLSHIFIEKSLPCYAHKSKQEKTVYAYTVFRARRKF